MISDDFKFGMPYKKKDTHLALKEIAEKRKMDINAVCCFPNILLYKEDKGLKAGIHVTFLIDF